MSELLMFGAPTQEVVVPKNNIYVVGLGHTNLSIPGDDVPEALAAAYGFRDQHMQQYGYTEEDSPFLIEKGSFDTRRIADLTMSNEIRIMEWRELVITPIEPDISSFSEARARSRARALLNFLKLGAIS